VTGLANSRQDFDQSSLLGNLKRHECHSPQNTDTIVGDHRPVMPEIAGQDKPRMASSPHAMSEIRELRP
jgi:hypothetical protein